MRIYGLKPHSMKQFFNATEPLSTLNGSLNCIKIGSTGIILGYCKDDDITAPINATANPTARLPLPKFKT